MRRPLGDRGTATAELAVALPAVGVLLASVAAVAQAGIAQVQVVDAARAGARAAARGDDLDRVRAVAAEAVTARTRRETASVRVVSGGGVVRVLVSRRVRLVLARGPAVRVSATAVAQRETGSATVLVLAVVVLALFLATVAGGVGAVAVARSRAASAADLGALAAADVLAGRAAGSPCAAAVRIVRAAGAVPSGCRSSGRIAEVVVTLRPTGPMGRFGVTRARARAGPAPMAGTAAAATG
jgi:secretion/DNA translocation related TadE-like protein